MEIQQQRNKLRKEQKVSTISYPDKPSSVPVAKYSNLRPSEDRNLSKIDQEEDITKQIEKVLYENQRWSEPINAPLQVRKKPNHSQIHDQAENFIVINSDNKKSVDAFLDSQDLQKLRQKARQLSRQNQKLKQENLQLRLQKMKLASNSQSMQLLQLKLQIQDLTKSISQLQRQKQQAIKKANINSDYFENNKNSSYKVFQQIEQQSPSLLKKISQEVNYQKESPYYISSNNKK